MCLEEGMLKHHYNEWIPSTSILYGRITLRILNSLNLIAKDYSLCTPIIYACTVIYLLSVRVYTAYAIAPPP